MIYQEFKKKYQGKGVDFDGNKEFWCVDTYRAYCDEVLNIPQSPMVRGAADIWNTYLKKYFKRIENTPAGVPSQGDIVLWSTKSGGGYGHVAVFDKGDAMDFTSLDQNWPIGSKCHLQTHSYTNVLGWLKFRQPANDIPTDWKKQYEELEKKHKEYVVSREEKVKDLEGAIESLTIDLKSRDDAIKELRKENAKLREEVKELMKTKPIFEAIKEPLRLLILAILPFLVAYFGNLSYGWAAIAVLVLRAVDKFLHEKGKETKNEGYLGVKGLTYI